MTTTTTTPAALRRHRGPGGPAGTAPADRRPLSRSDSEAVAAPRARRASGGTGSLEMLAATFAQLYLEVEAGLRSRRQLAPLVCPVLLARLSQVWVRPASHGTVVALRGAQPSADRYEAVAIIRRERRMTALALAFARRGRRWILIDALRPEDGPLPPPPVAFPTDEPDAFDLVCPPP